MGVDTALNTTWADTTNTEVSIMLLTTSMCE